MKPAPPVIKKRKLPPSEFLIVVLIVNGHSLPGLETLVERGSLRELLRAVALRIGIIPIRIVVVRGGGIDGVQNYTQEMGLDAEEQIARAHEGFLGSFAAAHHEENTVGFDGQDDGVGSGHDGWRIDDDELELGAKLGNGVAELMRRKEVGRIGRQRAGGYGGKIG